MAKVTLKQTREIEGGYHIYRQPSEAGDLITVRRKVATPSDVQHNSSKATQRHRQILSRASKRWAKIPPPIKALMSNNYAWVPTQGHFAEADYKVLTGMQLFVAQEMHKLEYHDGHIQVAEIVCAQAVDPTGRVNDVPLVLSNTLCPGCNPCIIRYLCPGNILFYPVQDVAQKFTLDTGVYVMHALKEHRYYYQELKAGVQQTHYPQIWLCNTAWPLSRTRAYDANWEYSPAAAPQNLWIATAHEPVGYYPEPYYPEPAAHFVIDKIDDSTIKVRIAPMYFHRDCFFGQSFYIGQNPFWQIHVTAPGEWTIEPDQYTMIYDWTEGKIIRYEF